MNRRQGIKQALLKLLPGLQDATLPKELETLTEALDSVHIHLEDNQKPAKLYLCAHIACDELFFHLGLPTLRLDRPPVPPKLYNKLYQQIKRDPQIRNVLSRSKTSTTAQEERDLAHKIIADLCEHNQEQVPADLVRKIMDVSTDLQRGFNTKTLVAASFLVAQAVSRKRLLNAERREYNDETEMQDTDTRAISSEARKALAKELAIPEEDIDRAYKTLFDTVNDKNWFLALMLGSGSLASSKAVQGSQKRFVLATLVCESNCQAF